MKQLTMMTSILAMLFAFDIHANDSINTSFDTQGNLASAMELDARAPGRPGRPAPGPRPAPRPGPRPAPRPVPRPAPRPVPRPAPRPVPRPAPRPVPRPVPRPIPPRPVPGNPTQIVHCSSSDYNFYRCFVGGYIRAVDIVRVYSHSDCILGQTWGYEPNNIWVDRGCRADFVVYY